MIGDIQLDREDGVVVIGGEAVEGSGLTRYSGNEVMRPSAACANERPKPRDALVMNQVRLERV